MNPSPLIVESEKLLNMMGITPKETSLITDTDLHIKIISFRLKGPDAEIFIENNNEVLREFSFILKTTLSKQHNFYKDIVVDVNSKNIALINHTKEKAQLALDRVRFFDKPYEFGYLNAYERMIIHTYMKQHPEVITESEGIGKDRKLSIKKKKA